VRFDLDRLAVTGAPVPVVEGVVTKGSGSASFSIASNGTLVYVQGSVSVQKRTLVWVDREGHEEPINVPPRAYAYARLSPDGTRLALDVRDEMNDIWVWSLARQTMTRLTFDPGVNRGAVWSPDGKRIAFSMARDGVENIYWQAADGSGTAEPLTSSTKESLFPGAFSPDGIRLLVNQPNPPRDIGVVKLDGDRSVQWLVKTSFDEYSTAVSPDGRWLAYQSDESGRAEVYVRPFPDVNSARWQVSTEGGTRPSWARNGRELFYYVEPGTVMSVPVDAASTFSAGTPRLLFKGPYLSPQAGRTYEVSLDGQRFLLIKEARSQDQPATPPQLVVVEHWLDELKRLVPVTR
jgi:serine/threonine-protein kinase